MNKQINKSTKDIAAEPITEQASATDATSTTQTTPAAPDLPGDYLRDGFLGRAANGQTFMRAEYLGETARNIAAALDPLNASAFYGAFVRDAKKQLRRGTPYEAQSSCVAAMLPQAIKLTAKHKAPAFLVDMITAATAAVHDAATFEAFYKHLDAIYSYLLQENSSKKSASADATAEKGKPAHAE